MPDTISEISSGSLLRNQWGFEDVKPDGGATMTLGGTTTKLFVLLAVFAIAFLLSWHHFHLLHLNESPAQKLNTLSKDLPAWQGYWLYTEFRYPLFAWLLFFISFAGCFFSQKGLVILAPVCVAVQGVSCGAFEYVLHDHYPGITLICGLIAMGMLTGMFLVYWLGCRAIDNMFTLFLAGAVGGIVLAYVAISIARCFGVDVAYLHELPGHWIFSLPMVLATGCGLLAITFADIDRAIDAGAPKWMEWRAAVCLFGNFLVLLKLARRLLLRRSGAQLVWESINDALKLMR
jgi:uncharacterized YccA/Bax inhibitor family protein